MAFLIVTQFGGEGNDITQGLLSAWRGACASPFPAKVLIPQGTFVLGEVILMGPCRAPIQIRVEANLKAPVDPSRFKPKGSWLTFKKINGFTLFGRGTLDGQGATAWAECTESGCNNLPVNVRFQYTTNGIIRDITSLNRKHFHACIQDSRNLSLINFSIKAPDDSPNTDGIHIGHSKGITITDSKIETGDDCVSIIHGSQQVFQDSIGSLGKFEVEEPVSQISVIGCSLINTNNGVRLKTWPGSRRGFASDIRFEDIVMTNVTNPTIINQTYCPEGQCNKQDPSGIKISKVIFKNIRGTTAMPLAVKLACSGGAPCEDVSISDIDLRYDGIKGSARSVCSFVKPRVFFIQNPRICGSFA